LVCSATETNGTKLMHCHLMYYKNPAPTLLLAPFQSKLVSKAFFTQWNCNKCYREGGIYKLKYPQHSLQSSRCKFSTEPPLQGQKPCMISLTLTVNLESLIKANMQVYGQWDRRKHHQCIYCLYASK